MNYKTEKYREYNREYRRKNKDKVKLWGKTYYQKHKKERRRANRGFHLIRRYDLTIEQYDKMFKKQKGVCAICGNPETVKNQYGILSLSVDHNHVTNKNRGLLCWNCNAAIGKLNVDNGLSTIYKVIEYIKGYKDANLDV